MKKPKYSIEIAIKTVTRSLITLIIDIVVTSILINLAIYSIINLPEIQQPMDFKTIVRYFNLVLAVGLIALLITKIIRTYRFLKRLYATTFLDLALMINDRERKAAYKLLSQKNRDQNKITIH